MGFLSPAFTALATGAVAQVDQNYDDTQAEQGQLLKDRQKVVDQVMAKQDSIDAKAQQTASRTKTYMAQYNIPYDQAYNLATDDSFDRMNPACRPDYIKSLQPTGKYIPGTPRDQAPPLLGPTQVNNGILGGGSFNIPGVQGVQTPATPARQIYQATGCSPKDKTRNSDAFKTVLKAYMEGSIKTPQDAMAMYHYMGGNDPNFKNFDWSRVQSTVDKPDDLQKDLDYAYRVFGIDPRVAVRVRMGIWHPMQDSNGDIKGIYSYETQQFYPTGKEIPFGDGSGSGVYVAPHPGVPGGAGLQKVPTTNAPPSVTTPGKPAINTDNFDPTKDTYFKKNYSVPAKQAQETYARMSETPKVSSAIGKVIKIAQDNPNAFGLIGAAIKYAGAPAVNIANVFSGAAGQQLSNTLGVAQKQELQSALVQLQASLQKPELAQFNPNNAAGFGTGGRETEGNWAQLFEHADIHSTEEGMIASLKNIQQNLNANFAADFNTMYGSGPQNLKANKDALNELGYKLTQVYGFDHDSAVAIAHMLIAKQSGQGFK